MLLRISLIIAILAGIGTIVVTQMQTRKNIQSVIDVRDENITGRAQEKARADKNWNTLVTTSNVLNQTRSTLAQREQELNNTRQQLAAAEAARQRLDTDLKNTIAARNAAQQELSQWSQLGMTPQQVRDTISNFRKAQEAIVVLEDEKAILSRQVSEWRNKYLTLVGDDYETELPPGTKGRIVAVDPKWNFVVLDMGKDKGLLEHGVLMVHRDSKFIGRVRISEVLDNRSIANVVPGTVLDDIQEGDQVLYAR